MFKRVILLYVFLYISYGYTLPNKIPRHAQFQDAPSENVGAPRRPFSSSSLRNNGRFQPEQQENNKDVKFTPIFDEDGPISDFEVTHMRYPPPNTPAPPFVRPQRLTPTPLLLYGREGNINQRNPIASTTNAPEYFYTTSILYQTTDRSEVLEEVPEENAIIPDIVSPQTTKRPNAIGSTHTSTTKNPNSVDLRFRNEDAKPKFDAYGPPANPTSFNFYNGAFYHNHSFTFTNRTSTFSRNPTVPHVNNPGINIPKIELDNAFGIHHTPLFPTFPNRLNGYDEAVFTSHNDNLGSVVQTKYPVPTTYHERNFANDVFMKNFQFRQTNSFPNPPQQLNPDGFFRQGSLPPNTGFLNGNHNSLPPLNRDPFFRNTIVGGPSETGSMFRNFHERNK